MTAAVLTADPPSAPPDISPAAAPSSTPPPTERPGGSIGFGDTATERSGLSMTVLPPDKILGGVRLTVALVNGTDTPINVDTAELGPHEVRFDGAPVPITVIPAQKKLVPGEGYTYQCVIQLPTMDPGQLTFTLGSVIVTDQAAGD